jgi:diguanylate cyclase (GGDEF)-like protein
MTTGFVRTVHGVMTSPFFYIIFSLLVSSAVLSVSFFIAWRNFGRRPHALTWAIAFFIGALQWGITLNGKAFSSPQIHLLTEYLFAVALITLVLRGHCQRTKCTWLPQNLFPPAAFTYAVAAWFILVEPHAGIARGIIPAYAGLTLLVSAFLIVTYRERTRSSERAAAIAISLFGLTQLAAAWIGFSQGAVRDAAIMASFMHFSFLTLPTGYMAMSIFVILMMASDISEKMREIAVHDDLTGLLNRRGFNEYGEKAYSLARRAGSKLSVIMADIDRFKYINDKFGHAAGDAALAHFARLFAEDRRKEDIVARVGGEEFAVLLPGTGLRDAMAMADQLCKKIGANPMDLTSIGLPMTSSFGVATLSERDTELDDVVRRADRALYRSKRAGRNQVDLESSQLMLRSDGTLQPIDST